MLRDKRHYCVISHTHWDREWYLPFEVFRVQLVDLIDHVLDLLERQPAYRFHLDAQTIVIEDYLAVRPAQRERLDRAIRGRRLFAGPWYVQNDFFLTSGEATVRNLLIGTRIAEDFGYCSRTGYAPDQFGLISQLPQILLGFGIDHCILGRGYTHGTVNAEGHFVPAPMRAEFEWRGAGGASILGICLQQWYNNAQRFPAGRAKALRYFEYVAAQAEATSATPYLLLMNGVDHLEAQEDLLDILGDLQAALPDVRIYQTTLEDYTCRVRDYLRDKALDVHCGELRMGPDGAMLQGTLSSRAYLKRDNARAQVLLENQLEPVWAMAGLLGTPEAYPADYLRHLWKRLLENHAHDSICGCSRDAVHDEMESRTARLMQCGETLLRRGLDYLCRRLDRRTLPEAEYVVLAVNTLGEARRAVVTASVRFPVEKDPGGFILRAADGRVVEYAAVAEARKAISVLSPINLPGQMIVREITVRFEADLPAMGYAAYAVVPEKSTAKPPAPSPGGTVFPLTIENECLALRVHDDGSLDLMDKRNGAAMPNVATFEDEADLGHSYCFRAEPGVAPLRDFARVESVELLERNAFTQSLRIAYAFELPAAYDTEAQRRTPERCPNRVVLTCALQKGTPRLDVDIEVDNHAKDHRLRLMLHTGIATEISRASSPFDLVERDRRDPALEAKHDLTQPNAGLILVQDDARSLAVFNEGLAGYEHTGTGGCTLAIPLVRATGTIGGHGDPRNLPEEWKAPGNQSLRTTRFRLGIMPGAPGIANPEARFREFLVPPLVHFDAVEPTVFSGGRPCIQDTTLTEIFHRPIPDGERRLPRERELVTLRGDVVLSALKRAEQGTGWVLRFFNPYAHSASVELAFGVPITAIQRLRMDETPVEDLSCKDTPLRIEAGPKEIVSLGFRGGAKT